MLKILFMYTGVFNVVSIHNSFASFPYVHDLQSTIHPKLQLIRMNVLLLKDDTCTTM